MLDVLLESRRYRQSVDEIEPDVAQHGELAEVLQRVHAAEPRDRVDEADRGRRGAGPPRQQVVQAAAAPRRPHRPLDELDDRRRRRLAAAAADAAARRQRLRTETESTCAHAKFPAAVTPAHVARARHSIHDSTHPSVYCYRRYAKHAVLQPWARAAHRFAFRPLLKALSQCPRTLLGADRAKTFSDDDACSHMTGIHINHFWASVQLQQSRTK